VDSWRIAGQSPTCNSISAYFASGIPEFSFFKRFKTKMPSSTAPESSANKLRALVIDAGPLIKNFKLHHLAEEFYTVSEVLEEVRDAAARQQLELTPYDIKVRSPSAEALKAGNDVQFLDRSTMI
jgi:hypothetical protein